MSTLTTVLTLGLILRATRLIVGDKLTESARIKLVLRFGPNNPFVYLVTCFWCMSVWVGAAVAAAAYWWFDTRWWFFMCLAATGSLLSGWTARWIDPEDQE